MPVEVFALIREREYRLWGLFVTSVYQFCLGTEKNYTYSAPKTRIMKCCDIRVMFNIMMFIALLNFFALTIRLYTDWDLLVSILLIAKRDHTPSVPTIRIMGSCRNVLTNFLS